MNPSTKPLPVFVALKLTHPRNSLAAASTIAIGEKPLKVLRDYLAEEGRLSAKVAATSPDAAKKKAKELSDAAINGDAEAMKTLEDAGGTALFAEKFAAMHSINNGVFNKYVRKHIGIWDAVSDILQDVGEKEDARFLQEWEAVYAKTDLPVPQRQGGQFATAEDKHPASTLYRQFNHACGRLKGLKPTPWGAIGYGTSVKANPTLEAVLLAPATGGLK